MKYYFIRDELKKKQFYNPEPISDEENKANKVANLEKVYKICKIIYYLVSDVNIHIEDSKISDIPIATVDENKSIKDYFNQEKPNHSLELTTKSVSFNFSRLYKDSAGFEFLFNPKQDIPFHVTCSIQLLKIHFAKRIKFETGYIGQESDEILNIPNFSFTSKANILHQLITQGGFKNCVSECYFSTSTPMLDIDTKQLSSLLYNYVLIKKYSSLQKIHNHIHNDSKQKDNESKFEMNKLWPPPKESLKSRIWRYLNEFYPQLDIKLVIEQPRFILRHCEETALNNKNIQLLTFSYSLLNFNMSTTKSRDYILSCQILYPNITYNEKSNIANPEFNNEIFKKEIASLKYFNIQIDVYKNLKVKTSVDFSDVNFDLTSLDIFSGVHYLLLDITKIAEHDLKIGKINNIFNEELNNLKMKLINKEIKTQKIKIEDKIFRHLPKWITKVELKLNSLCINLGSRSVLIPKQDLSKTSAPFDFDIEEDHILRKLTIKVKSFNSCLINNEEAHDKPDDSSSETTLTSFTDDTGYWSVQTKLEDLDVIIPDKDLRQPKMIDLPSLKININTIMDFNGENKLIIDSEIDKIAVDFSRFKLFTTIGAVYLIREYVISPIKLIKSKVRKDLSQFHEPISKQEESKGNILDFIRFNFKLNNSDFVIRLSDDFKVKIQLANLQINLHEKLLKLSLNFIRALADSPLSKDKWCRLLCVDSLSLNMEVPSRINKRTLTNSHIDIYTDAIRLIQPNGFIVYKLFDNISITVKAAKHLVKLLKDDSNKEELNIIHPHSQNPIPLPTINIKSRHLKFLMEDDPFESELNMIYQLGLVEQRKRLELYSIFDETARNEVEYGEDYFNKLMRLHTTISDSWIRKVNVYKTKLVEEVASNKDYLFGNEVNFNQDYNKDVVAYPYHSPLLGIYMDNFNLTVSKPKFDMDQLPQFIYDFGQGVPKDTKYSLYIPTYLDLKVGEFRMHLRDYPLPMLHAPRNKNASQPSVILEGHLIITEALVTAVENLRQLDTPLTPIYRSNKNAEISRFDQLIIEKTLASVKMYTNLLCQFDSDYPTRIIWGTSYNFGIQQFMLNFDQFSKPPVDPSMKLGFWDKLKYILHGKCRIKTRKSLEVGFKGSRDPYNLFTTSTGFVLSFKENVIWDINKNDDSKNFFDINAEKVSWYIPNYLGSPLLSWTRSSIDSVYLPESKNFISSCFAYYLDSSTRDSISKIDFDYAKHVFAKNVIQLSGGVNFKVGFLLQRKENGERVDDFKSHYDVQLYNPKYCEKGHDSYKDFRSEYIHISISLSASTESSYNTIHLSPGAFQQFFGWWRLFASNMMLPVRKGPLFGEAKQNVKFSQHLYTIKFLFYLKSLFISHVYRDEIIDTSNDRIECVGLRAKVDEFSVDLHQRKEPTTLHHEELSKDTKTMKMNMNLGEVVLSGIDLRAIHTSFKQNLYNKSDIKGKSTYSIFDDNKRWYDLQDYEEAFLPTLKGCPKDVNIYPLLYSHRFSYERDTSNEEVNSSNKHHNNEGAFGNEKMHECRLKKVDPLEVRKDVLEERLKLLQEQIVKVGDRSISKQLKNRIAYVEQEIGKAQKGLRASLDRNDTFTSIQTEEHEHYHNKFTLFSMLLKWNFNCRNLLLKYIHFVQLKAAMRKYLSHESIMTLDNIMEKASKLLNENESDLSSIANSINEGISQVSHHSKDESSENRLANFSNILKFKNQDEKLNEDYLIEIISPQIQLHSDDYPDSVVMISAPNINGKILSTTDSNDSKLEERYGVLLKDASVFVLNKKDVVGSDSMIIIDNPYGGDHKSNWPPWLGQEVTQNGKWAGENQLLIEKLSVMALFYNSEILSGKLNSAEEGEDSHLDEAPKKLRIDMPSIVITSTSSQYFSMYVIMLSLLFYSEPMSKVISDKLEKMKFAIDFQDLPSMSSRVKSMQQHYKKLKFLTSNYDFRQENLSNEDLNNFLQINLERGEIASDIYLLLKTLYTGDFVNDISHNIQQSWLIRADEVILHLLEDDRTPIMDLALAKGTFKRKELESGSNINRIEIEMMQGFNLIKTARFPDFLQPFPNDGSNTSFSSYNLIDLEWTMNKAVGGIKIIEHLKINSLPLNIKIDEITGEKLTNFIFQSKDPIDIKNSKVLNVANNVKQQELNENDGSDDEFGLITELEGANKSSDRRKQDDEGKGTTTSNSKMKKNFTGLSTSSNSNKDVQEDDEQVAEMIKRSKEYYSIISLTIKAISLKVTLKLNKGYKRILNVTNFKIDLPELNITNRILSFVDLSKIIGKLVTKSLLAHIGSLLRNKVTRNKLIKAKEIKSIDNYKKFTKISELEA
ncbi:unnamed protein product [Candida verbasci]|uniref:Uncharacterized protein n=1 Tax=Candida verbasci TaxID=1227364 RepID=A0A9W4XFN2_9ASCO|nr:unnamed protein product [Candida verbasci]